MLMPRLGTRKLHHLLSDAFNHCQLKVGRDKLFSILRMERMLISPLKNFTVTTNSKHWLRKHPNLIKEKEYKLPEQLWVSDITYLKTKECVSYLSLVTDAVSRRIMGYHLSGDLRTEGALKALKMAVGNRMYSHALIHHSDRGVQYCSEEYQQVLRENKISTSMTDGYDCYQNALAERINGILKMEFLLATYQDIDQAQKVIKQSIAIYNQNRPHLALKMDTPNNVHRLKGQTHKKTTRTLKGSCGFLSSRIN
jgi:putative transposase